MFFRTKKPPAEQDSALAGVIAETLPDAAPDTRAVVAAIAGLLGCVAYADREFSARERAAVRRLLASVHGVDGAGADRIIDALASNIVEVSTLESTRYCRTLMMHGERDLRVDVLDMLLEVAAADREVTHDEVVVLRTLTKALGLDQEDYNRLQTRHQALLTTLRLAPP